MVQQSSTIEIFCCYAHKDEDLLHELKTHLSPLQRQKTIQLWHDGDISAGTEWDQEIKQRLNNAEIILLLISSDFIASEYCYGSEMKHALERHKRREARVIPVIIRPTDWRILLPLSRLQALPKSAKAVTSWQNRDEAWADVAEGISKVVTEQENRRSSGERNTIPNYSSIHQVSASSEQVGSRVGNTLRLGIKAFITTCVLVLLILVSIVGVALHQSQLNAANVTATQVATGSQASYIPSGWKFAFSDPLNKPFYWQGGSNAKFGGSCLFRNEAYHIVLAKGGNFFCQPPTNTFSNMAVKVSMTIIQGNCGGLWFRGYPNGKGPAYLFQVCQNGQYALILYDTAGIQTLLSSASPAMHTGLKQSNSLAVVAIGAIFDFYVNQQKIGSTSDSTLSSGEINFGAIGADPTDVAFRNVEVWTP